MSLLGLDIGRSSIKAVQLEPRGERYLLQAIGKVSTPPRGLESEAEADEKAVVEAIKSLLRESNVKTKSVVASLPDSKIFTRLINLPLLTDDELSSSIQWEADQYIPIPLEKIQLHWQVVDKQTPGEGGKMEVLLVAAPKHLVARYIKIIKTVGLEIKALETESSALTRSLFGSDPSPPTTLIVSLGYGSTDLSIIRRGKVVLTRSISTGDAAFTRAIANHLGFDPGQAEAYKNAYGVVPDKLEGKLVEAIGPILEVILGEINRATAFYLNQRPSDPVKRAVLSGGPARMPGLVVYFAEKLGYEVIVGDPWSKTDIDPSIAEAVKKEAAEYAVAAGLAMRKVQ
jgi:type IV pilus assembly protein PilM